MNAREQQCCIRPVSLSKWVLRNFDLLQNLRLSSSLGEETDGYRYDAFSFLLDKTIYTIDIELQYYFLNVQKIEVQ